MSSTPVSVPFQSSRFLSGLLPRLIGLAALFSLELVLISVWVDGAALNGAGGLARFTHDWGAWIVRALVGFAALFATFTWLQNKDALIDLSHEIAQVPLRWGMAAGHFGAMAGFVFLSWLIYGGGFGGLHSNGVIACWLLAGILGIGLACAAAIPYFAWRRLFLGDRLLWLCGVLAILFACLAGDEARTLWSPMANLTFDLAKAMLKPFAPGVIADASKMILGTPRFQVEIAPECSGFEGAGLIAAFGIVWLIVFRKVCRWPQALLLIPAGVCLLFLLNAARIAALILIGNAGAERIALGGFHSQAGWIAFNFVALGFSIAAREVPWFTTQKPAETQRVAVENAVTPWVLPFVAIMAAGMVSSALRGDFEWLYPLRFVAAAGALWCCRHSYRKLDWRFGWEAPAAGVVVFALWIVGDVIHGSGAGMPGALAGASPGLRDGWLLTRILSAVVTVPIAEELAFRGFLMRRLVSPDFESVPWRRVSWAALLVSSVLFGLLHGSHWLAGVAAGAAYALVLRRHGRIGDAVIAHAVSNALLAFYVLGLNQWQLW